MTLPANNLTALWNEIDRLAAETRQLREKIARGWELARPDGVAVYNSANLSIPNEAWTAVTFNSERRDDAGFHSVVTNTERLTVPAGLGGWYAISGHVRFAANATGYIRAAYLRQNGETGAIIAVDYRPPLGNSLTTDISLACIYFLSAGECVWLSVYQDSGGNLNVEATPNYSPELRMVRIM